MNDRQIHIVRHALGLTNEKKAYRNYYTTDTETEEPKKSDLAELVSRGVLAVRNNGTTYYVTTEWVHLIAGYDHNLELSKSGIYF